MNKNYLVTGASSGIGKAVATYLADQGNQIICLARNEELLKETCSYSSNHMWYIPYDLMNLNDIEQIYSQIREKTGKLHGLIHCAGINRDMPIRVNDISEMQQVMDTNCHSFIELGKHFSLKKYSEDGSSIVAISSTASLVCDKGMCTYAASKAALNAVVKIMSKEFIKRKIRVNAILPNFVDTDMTKKSMEYIDSVYQPLGIIEPVYIAYFVEFLLSDNAKYITGSLLPMTAGA